MNSRAFRPSLWLAITIVSVYYTLLDYSVKSVCIDGLELSELCVVWESLPHRIVWVGPNSDAKERHPNTHIMLSNIYR